MKYYPEMPDLFAGNRSRFAALLEPGSIAIFVSNDEMPSDGDAHYPFRQSSDLFWLSGIVQEDSMVILFPDHPDDRYKEVLVLARPNEQKEKWDGRRLRAEEARKISGIQTIVWLDMLDGLLQQWIHLADNIYLNSNENDRRSGPLVTRQHRYIHEVKERYPLHRFMRSAKILRQLRAVKSAREVAVMQKAAEITGDVFRHLLSFIRPGVMEYEIEAEIWKGFLSRRSTGPAYESIIASGDRARTLHYIVNDGQCRGGELVLMDFGAAFGGYNADMTRTVPVSGKFSGRQRELYDAVLSLHADAKHLLRPGITLADYNKKMGERATEVFIGVGLLTEAEVRDQTPESPAYMKYMYHGVSHHLGIDVHDLGPRTEPLREGMVLTVEPGVYVAEEGIGIRIENDIWIQPGANVDLMENVPISADEIEGWMNKRK